MKKFLIGFAALAVIAAVAAVLLVGNLDRIIEKTIEEVGSKLLGTRVGVAAVELDLKGGAGRISGLRIANPAGFPAGSAFQTDTIRLALRLSSLKSQPLIVDDLTVRDPLVRLEVTKDGNSNLEILLDNMKKNSARADRRGAEGPREGDVSREEGRRIRFERLAITGVKVQASIPGREPETVSVPDIVMRNVGEAAGLTPAEIGEVVIGEVVRKSLEAALRKKMTEEVREAAEDFLGDLQRRLLPEKKKRPAE